MIRLFLDSFDTLEPNDDGWTIVGSLVKSQHKENSSLSSNSIMCLLQQYSAGDVVRIGPRTVWHGIQHATRSLPHLVQEDMVWQKLNELEVNNMTRTTRRSHAVSITRWLAIRVAERQLLPIQMMAAGFFHMDGYDPIGSGPKSNLAVVDKQISFLFSL